MLTILDLAHLHARQVDVWTAGPRFVSVSVLAFATTDEQPARQHVRFHDQIHGRVIVPYARDGGVFGALGVDEPTMNECDTCAGEERELSTCRGRAKGGR